MKNEILLYALTFEKTVANLNIVSFHTGTWWKYKLDSLAVLIGYFYITLEIFVSDHLTSTDDIKVYVESQVTVISCLKITMIPCITLGPALNTGSMMAEHLVSEWEWEIYIVHISFRIDIWIPWDVFSSFELLTMYSFLVILLLIFKSFHFHRRQSQK